MISVFLAGGRFSGSRAAILELEIQSAQAAYGYK
jgi:hypothetical protein